MFENINASVFQKEISRNPHAIILDVRTPEEFNAGFIQGAINIDFRQYNFKSEVDKLDKNAHYLIYCRSGARSYDACNLMQSMGFKKLVNMKGGILTWRGNISRIN